MKQKKRPVVETPKPKLPPPFLFRGKGDIQFTTVYKLISKTHYRVVSMHRPMIYLMAVDQVDGNRETLFQSCDEELYNQCLETVKKKLEL